MRRKPQRLARAIGAGITLLSLCAPWGAGAEGIYAYPLAGQSKEQQQKDHSQCQEWATKQTGFNPSEPPPQVATAPSTPPPSGPSGVFGRGSYGKGGGVADTAKGAAGGALFGAIAGDAGKGAAIGAVSGLFIGAVKRSSAEAEQAAWQRQQAQERQQQQQAANAAYARQQQEFESAYKTCMRARKYEVN